MTYIKGLLNNRVVKMMHLTFLGCGSSSGVPTIRHYWGRCSQHPKNHRTRSALWGCFSQHKSLTPLDSPKTSWIKTSSFFHQKKTISPIILKSEYFSFLIDAGPDLRQQCLRENITHIHGVLCTHDHYDHVAGFEELKHFALYSQQPLPVWCSEETYYSLQKSSPHRWCKEIFDPWGQGLLKDYENVEEDTNKEQYLSKAYKELYEDFCQRHFVDFFHHSKGRQPFLFPCLLRKKSLDSSSYYPFFFPFDASPKILPMEHHHDSQGFMKTLGFHFGSWAYSTDLYSLSPQNKQDLFHTPLWIVDCLALKENPYHSYLDKTLQWIQDVQSKESILTHMGPDIDYTLINHTLPPGVSLAYDGLSYTFS